MRIKSGDRGSGPPPPWKITKYRVPQQCWSGSLVKPQSYLASIQCWATIDQPAKRRQAYDVPLIVVFGSSLPSSTRKKNVVKFESPLKKHSGSPHDAESPPNCLVLKLLHIVWDFVVPRISLWPVILFFVHYKIILNYFLAWMKWHWLISFWTF